MALPNSIFDSVPQSLIPGSTLNKALENLSIGRDRIKKLIETKKWADDPWDDRAIERLLDMFSMLDSNNFETRMGVGEREGRIFSRIVARRYFNFSHGIGRSGDLGEAQPKAVGSTLLSHLTNELVLDLLRREVSEEVCDAFILPMATGMSMTLVLLTLKKLKPNAKYVIWSRIDQKSCFKSILTAGLVPHVAQSRHDEAGRELTTRVDDIVTALNNLKPENVLCVLSTTSCFAPRVPDDLKRISRLCADQNLYHVCNNAYGLQSDLCTHAVKNALSDGGRLDVFIQSTDKNLLVPVGGCIVSGFNKSILDKIRQNYPGRATLNPTLDCLVTMLSMGRKAYIRLKEDRVTCFQHLKSQLKKVAKEVDEVVLDTPGNDVSIAMSLKNVAHHFDFKVQDDTATEIGSMLFHRNVCGARVVSTREVKSIDGITFDGWGSHGEKYNFPYITAAAGIGGTSEEITAFCSKLESCIKTLRKKSDWQSTFENETR